MSTLITWQSYTVEQLLVERFHIQTGFHPTQRMIIEQIVHGRRVLAIQRTGWGKSLCYQIASLYFPHLTLVFSPLKALMRDQWRACVERYQIPAAMICSDFTEEANQEIFERSCQGEFKLLYITPERLSNRLWQQYLPHLRISLLVIDEAHCISTWGHDFRPDYRRIAQLFKVVPVQTPVLALTASANLQVERDILQQMGGKVQVVRGTMQRQNLALAVIPLKGDYEKLCYLGETLRHNPGTGLIYTATQKDAEMVASFLQLQGMQAEYYHAGRDSDIRQDVEQKLMSNQYKVVCSTNALGMGIDKNDLRFIIHYQIPASPIHYYQEMGRAGRDEQLAWCILLYDSSDLSIQEHFIRDARPAGNCYKMVFTLLLSHPRGLNQEEIRHQTGLSKQSVRIILSDLEDQHIITRQMHTRNYRALPGMKQFDPSPYDDFQRVKLRSLHHMRNYAQSTGCYMQYLTYYLGEQREYQCGICGRCQPDQFPAIKPSERMQKMVTLFLEEENLPRIERRSEKQVVLHEAGWALSFHGTSSIGRLVRASKYEGAGPFALSLVKRSVEVLSTRYRLEKIQGITSVPSTVSGLLVEDFARQVAEQLQLPFLAVLEKARTTQQQKTLRNALQKAENVKGSIKLLHSHLVRDKTLLLIDDIYDSGQMLREVSRCLIQAGAMAIYPFTITRTMHSDDH
ncbi:RecQ family ATP-dependent DNA helicase [Tengunoibacter tsumagoiensis]|uniref:ATP-dependent DNA helicase RecQ n=1 Tax=Tengunoibacter tsumagoiensis TaxID=2014871 RepID=A0A401ZWS4_9CHLR|nr:RecQ family ATP-dependent DNA helicase [Tengunoibacter tsumagoiensis]GCE11369.1 ATP-dependent DNA helicase RecG [Tengunoibacter tsumagoiensis]